MGSYTYINKMILAKITICEEGYTHQKGGKREIKCLIFHAACFNLQRLQIKGKFYALLQHILRIITKQQKSFSKQVLLPSIDFLQLPNSQGLLSTE